MSMSGFPILAAPTTSRPSRLTVPSRQYYRTPSGSPNRQHFNQHVDDLLSQLTPQRAVSSLRKPVGALKACLNLATIAEQDFAMRAALASSSIQEWLDEMNEWEWPEGGGSAGFEEPSAPVQGLLFKTEYASTTPTSTPPHPSRQGRGLSPPPAPEASVVETESTEPVRMGSLFASDVYEYERRTAEIVRDIEELEMEDMKQHVLHHHILPLSPPGTPPVEGRFRSSTSSINTANLQKMDDLTAVVTAIVLQALPLLSKLTRLLDVWRVRLAVLKKIPLLMARLSEAEAALRTAWDTFNLKGHGRKPHAKSTPTKGTLLLETFAAMKSELEGKVSLAAQMTDFMLDTLDGWEDTIPEQWIDRIDAAERDYGEWVATCERKIRNGEWKHSKAGWPPSSSPVLDNNATDVDAMGAADSSLAMPEDLTYHSLSVQSSTESFRFEPELPSFRLADPFDKNGVDEPDSPSASIIHFPSDEPVSRCAVDQPRGGASDMGNISYLLSDEDNLETPPAAGTSPSSSPPDLRSSVRSTTTFSDMPTVIELPDNEGSTGPATPLESSFMFDEIDMSENLTHDVPRSKNPSDTLASPASTHSRRLSPASDDDQLQQQISEILESIPAKIHLSSQPAQGFSHLNPPDFNLPTSRKPRLSGSGVPGGSRRSSSSAGQASTSVSGAPAARSLSSMSTRSMTPSFLLAPAYTRNSRSRQQRSNQDIKLYHLSRSTGEAPIKLFIRLVGGSGERVMVRVGGGWADLSEYLKEYASHHSRRSKQDGESAKIEIKDLPALPASSSVATSLNSRVGSSPPSRPASALDTSARRRPESPLAMPSLNVRKVRRVPHGSFGGSESADLKKPPQTPLASVTNYGNGEHPEADENSNSPASGNGSSGRSRSSSQVSWTEEDSSLGMSGPRAKKIEMSDESKAWVESVKQRVRIASGEHRAISSEHGRQSFGHSGLPSSMEGSFGEMGRVGGTKRLFRKGPGNKALEK